LHIAALNGRKDAADLLVASKADVDALDELLAGKADVNAKANDGRTFRQVFSPFVQIQAGL
jgi:ankyrin repeat protein